MSVKSELNEVIKRMESDLATAKNSQQNPHLEEYGQGYVDGVVESMECSIKFMKEVTNRLSWEETPNPVRGDMDNEFGDVPPIRQGMGG